MLINRSGTMVIPFMTIYCTERLHFTISQAGFIMALFGAGAVTGSFIGGKIVDSIGFYWLQICALISGGLMFITIGFLHSFDALCAGVFILSICNESFRPANATAITYYSDPGNITRSYSLNRLAINVGWGIGGALGGFIAAYNYHLLFWVDGITNILAAIFLIKLLPVVNTVMHVHKKNLTIKKASPYNDKQYLAFIFMVMLFALCFFQMFTMVPVFFKSQWQFNERFIGFLMALNGIIIAIVEMIMIHNLENKKGPLYFVAAGTFLLGIGYISMNVFEAGKMTAVFAIVLITFAEMLAVPFMNTIWTKRSNNSNRGGYAALYAIAWSVAQIISPTVGSQLIASSGFSLLWRVVSIICFIVSAVVLILRKKIV